MVYNRNNGGQGKAVYYALCRHRKKFFIGRTIKMALTNAYLKGVYEKVEQRNPGEKELSELKELARGMVSWSKCVEE